jgi:hypothetical protein
MVFGKKAAVTTELQTVNPALVQELPPTSAQVAAQLEEARAEAARRAEEAKAARLGYENNPSRPAKDAELNAQVERDIAATRVRRLERELTETQDREAEEGRQRQYGEAKQREQAIPGQKRRWDELCGQLADLAAEIDKDTRMIKAANANLPGGAERLLTLEDHRARPSRTETVKTRHQGWIIETTGQPYRGGAMTIVGGKPSVRGVVHGHWEEEVEKLIPAYVPDRLLETLVLPASDGSRHWPKK